MLFLIYSGNLFAIADEGSIDLAILSSWLSFLKNKIFQDCLKNTFAFCWKKIICDISSGYYENGPFFAVKKYIYSNNGFAEP